MIHNIKRNFARLGNLVCTDGAIVEVLDGRADYIF